MAIDSNRYLEVLGLQVPLNIRAELGREPKRILCVCTHRLGDMLVTLPAVQAVRDSFPRARITMIVAAEQMALLEGCKFVDRLEPLPLDEWELLSRAKGEDVVFCFRRSPPAPDTATLWFSFSTDLFLGSPKPAHEHYLEVLRLLGVKARSRRPRITLRPAARAFARRFLRSSKLKRNRPTVAVHPGSYYKGKRWPAERYARVLAWLSTCYEAGFVMVQGRGEASLVEEVVAGIPSDRVAVLDEESLPNVAAVLARCTFYLGNDTGIMHVAGAVGLPTVTVFGPSRPGVWGASGPRAVHLFPEEVWNTCTRCSGRKAKDQPCFRPGTRPCLNSIHEIDMIGAIESLAALIHLRDRFRHLDHVRVADNVAQVPYDENGLILANLPHMKPLFIADGRERALSCLNEVARHGSYSRIAAMGPDERNLLDTFFTYRIVLPAHETETVASETIVERNALVLRHPLIGDLGRWLTAVETNPGQSVAPPLVAAAGTPRPKRSPKKRLRALFVNTIAHSIYGGGERWMIRTGRALADRGHDILCWGLSSHKWLADAQDAGMTCLAREVPLTLDFGELGSTIQHLQRLKLDAALLNLDREVLSLALPLRMAEVPVIMARKGLPTIEDRAALRWAYARVLDGVVVPSAHTREEILGAGWMPPEKVRVVVNGVDGSSEDGVSGLEVLRLDLDLKPDTRVVLSIGRLTEQKGTIHLVRAMEVVLERFPEAKLLIVGRGPSNAALLDEVDAKAVAEHVSFLGERWDTARMLALADCFVLPSLYEGMSTALLEAMRAGVPVVATAVSSAPEVITNGVTGYLVPPADPIAIGNAICRVFQEEGKKSPVAREGRRYVREHHAFEKMVDAIEELLRFGL